MTFYDDTINIEGGEVVPELKLRVEGDDGVNGKGETLRQRLLEECEAGERDLSVQEPGFCSLRGRSIWFWIKSGILFTFIGLLAAVFFKWVGPFLMDKELMPIINWEMTTFSTPVLAVLVFASVALFPTILLPSTPSIWVAGMTFGYGFGFLLIISAAAVGVSLPFFIGSLFLHRIQGWLEKCPKKAAILRAAGEGNWFHQFKVVTLIRISPFPYIIYNYCAVATHVKYGPYILGSLVGMVPEIFVAIYTGILIQTLADASQERHSLSAPQILLNVGGFLLTVVTAIVFTVYAKRKLKVLQGEELVLL
ncbi:putative LRR receptor-like serine/threonine-protein kinase [Hibiscus syriacus]|uniref:LRR receptor-like serine/threonine-protein kinase n=1 Tax=Hibiscus syriacus TaxID=106335 RepID=A0A6A3B6C5_HIBSY|nr:transmembrane protein 64-like [Hibiscus syriacus]KAE8710835.1 putative LRR receptor-like serine/threonine-protein kinase [Hibiscus syriacus]